MPARRLALALALDVALAACEERGPGLPEPTFFPVQDAGSVISVPRRAAEGCPALEGRARWGRGTLHGGTVRGHERWSREGSPHRLPNGIHLLAGAAVDVAPCAVVLVGAGRDFVVQDDARLTAAGAPDAPIVFGSAADRPAQGDWVGLEIRARALPGTRLAHATVEHAGAEPAQRGDPAAAIRSAQTSGLDIERVTVATSEGFGVALLGDGGFSPRARGLRVTAVRGAGAVSFADVEQVATLPEGDYSGNANDDIVVAATRRELRSDATWRPPGVGVRYRIRRGARVIVQGPASPTLAIAPGATVAFEDDAELDVGWDAPGALVADGHTEAQRITFTSARRPPLTASWVGIVLGPRTDTARTRLHQTAIEGAGALATGPFTACALDDGAPLEARGMLFLHGVSAEGLVTSTRFVAGPPGGVAVFRSGDLPLDSSDFTRPSHGNEFALAGVRCAQSERPRAGRCPRSRGCR